VLTAGIIALIVLAFVNVRGYFRRAWSEIRNSVGIVKYELDDHQEEGDKR
jgi:hypothetical protein